jgi:hypothetical protein
MGLGKSILKLAMVGIILLGMSNPAMALLGNKFEKEVEKETGAVKLVREVQRGGYDVVTTEELKQWIDSRKQMVIHGAAAFKICKAQWPTRTPL